MQRYRNIPDSFLQFDILPFLLHYGEQDIVHITLRLAGKYPFDIAFLADQLAIYPKAKIKIPSFSDVCCLFTPLSFEQSSSEILAEFKASLLSGDSLLDLSGGLGVDDWAFSKVFKRVISVDIDAELNKLVRSNFEKLKVVNMQRLDADAYLYVDKNVDKYDVVFVDADRRINDKRGFALSDTEPDILKLKEKLFTFSGKILLKVSPMLDIHAIIKELEDVAAIWVVSAKNEVKELLLLLQQEHPEKITLHAVDITGKVTRQYSSFYNERHEESLFNDTGKWFYEPALSLIKSGLAPEYLSEHGIRQLGPHSFFGVSSDLVTDFFGRSFHIMHMELFSKSGFKKYLKDQGIIKANIAKRNFPIEAEAIKKQFGIKDGGADYLFFTKNASGKTVFYHCIKPL